MESAKEILKENKLREKLISEFTKDRDYLFDRLADKHNVEESQIRLQVHESETDKLCFYQTLSLPNQTSLTIRSNPNKKSREIIYERVISPDENIMGKLELLSTLSRLSVGFDCKTILKKEEPGIWPSTTLPLYFQAKNEVEGSSQICRAGLTCLKFDHSIDRITT